MGKTPKYSNEFIIAALKELENGKSAQEVAKAFSTNKTTIYRWVNRAQQGKIPGFTLSENFEVKIPVKYSDEFRIAAVRRIEAGESRAEVARDLKVAGRSLTDWCVRFRDPNSQTVRGEEEAQRIVQTTRARDALKKKVEAEAAQKEETKRRETEKRVLEIMADPLLWMQKYTQSKDSHWREHGARSPYRPFPQKPYLRPAMEGWQQEQVVFIEKSRNMMLSWLAVGFFTHAAMTTPGIEVRFQSQKEDKAFELVDYAKVLYDRQPDELKEAFPLVKKLKDMADGELLFANGSRIVGIPGGADQIRSHHPWGLLMDEAAYMPEAGDSYNAAVPVCKKILIVSSAGPGWFADVCSSGIPITREEGTGNREQRTIKGFTQKRAAQGLIQRIHYSADAARDAQWVTEERKKYSSQNAWDREQEIVHEAGGGERIFAEVLGRWEDRILIDPDKGFQVSPHWKRIGAFDHGKANPTAALVAAMDQDGILYILSEYYQPNLSPRQHVPNLKALHGFTDSEIIIADPSIFYKSQAQSDGSFKAIVELYQQEGISNMMQAPDTAEEAGIERILDRLLNLDSREPTLRIVCPKDLRDIGKPIYGVHNEGCPNLLWELKRARREELSAGQLVNKNPSEKIVDRDNHLRDCLKYLCLTFVEPPKPTAVMMADEAVKDIPLNDADSRMIRWNDAYLKAKEADDAPQIPLGRRGRYLMMRRDALKNFRAGRNRMKEPSSF